MLTGLFCITSLRVIKVKLFKLTAFLCSIFLCIHAVWNKNQNSIRKSSSLYWYYRLPLYMPCNNIKFTKLLLWCRLQFHNFLVLTVNYKTLIKVLRYTKFKLTLNSGCIEGSDRKRGVQRRKGIIVEYKIRIYLIPIICT